MSQRLEPRKHFQEKKDLARAHQDLVVNDGFRAAMQAALLDQLLNIPMTYEPNEAVAAYNRLMGARDFVNHLLNIAEQTKSPPQPLTTNLDHRVH